MNRADERLGSRLSSPGTSRHRTRVQGMVGWADWPMERGGVTYPRSQARCDEQ